MENTNNTDNTRQAGHSADSTINAGTDIKSSTTNTSSGLSTFFSYISDSRRVLSASSGCCPELISSIV